MFAVPKTLGQESLPRCWDKEENIRGALRLTLWRLFSTQSIDGHRPETERGLGLSERPFSKTGKDDKVYHFWGHLVGGLVG